MIDPQPLSRQVGDHDVRAARFRLQQDSSILYDVFVGTTDASSVFQDVRLDGQFKDLVYSGGAFEPAAESGEPELQIRLREIQEEIAESKVTLESRRQSIAAGQRR